MEHQDTDRVRASSEPIVEPYHPYNDGGDETVQRALLQEQACALLQEQHLHSMDVQYLNGREESGRLLLLAEEAKERRRFTKNARALFLPSSQGSQAQAEEELHSTSQPAQTAGSGDPTQDGDAGAAGSPASPFYSQQWTMDERQARWHDSDEDAAGEQANRGLQGPLAGFFLFGMLLGVFCS